MNNYNHVMDIAFQINSTKSDWEKLDAKEILAALKSRVEYLEAHPQELMEAVGHLDTYES